jgi:uncharacterized repeat protein (TIGR04076 family)
VYRVTATVKSIGGQCAFHRLGDQIVYDGRSIDGRFCPTAFMAMMPTLFAMRLGAQFPGLEDPDVMTFACPDAKNPVVFELRRAQQ